MITKELTARARIRVRSTPAEVFAAFADGASMSKFWFTRRDALLTEGDESTWYLGSGPDASSFVVQVKQVSAPDTIVIQWPGPDESSTQVKWTFEEADAGNTLLTVEESGFAGIDEEIVARVIDSTCGFNQVIVAAKALVEHGIALNVVADHV